MIDAPSNFHLSSPPLPNLNKQIMYDPASASPTRPHFLIIGGGIAGVSCAETLHVLRPDSEISLISATTLVKSVSNLRLLGKVLENFDVEEKSATELERRCPNVSVIQGKAAFLDPDKRVVVLSDQRRISYDKLCVCTGATPKLIVDRAPNDDVEEAVENPFVIGIRDVESVVTFQRKLASARRICVVGNGGISLELVYEIYDCEVVWSVRHDAIGNTFFDAGSAHFLAPRLFDKNSKKKDVAESLNPDSSSTNTKYLKRPKFQSELVNGVSVFTKNPLGGGGLEGMEDIGGGSGRAAGDVDGVVGSALGPDWKESLSMKGALRQDEISTGVMEGSQIVHEDSSCKNEIVSNVVIELKVEVKEVIYAKEFKSRTDLDTPLSFQNSGTNSEDSSNATDDSTSSWPIYVVFSNGHVWGVDFVVSATGVEPTSLPLIKDALKSDSPISEAYQSFATSVSDGGVLIDAQMRTSVHHVFAAGDAATANWTPAPNWFQMRLWSQARQMGGAAAKAMVADVEGRIDDLLQDFCFELFAHVTKFFDYKCVLIGRYNGQGLENEDDYHVILRTTPGVEFIKLIVAKGKIHGAVLIGETDLEETFENLILNQFDVSEFEEDILDPEVDIEDFFD